MSHLTPAVNRQPWLPPGPWWSCLLVFYWPWSSTASKYQKNWIFRLHFFNFKKKHQNGAVQFFFLKNNQALVSSNSTSESTWEAEILFFRCWNCSDALFNPFDSSINQKITPKNPKTITNLGPRLQLIYLRFLHSKPAVDRQPGYRRGPDEAALLTE